MTRTPRVVAAFALTWAAVFGVASAVRTVEPSSARTFATPEEAVKALADAVKAGNVDQLSALFGAERELAAAGDAVAAQRRRGVFTVAFAERWRLIDRENGGKTLVIGREDWPFPVPLVRDAQGWRFDGAAGKEEVVARRIGRNELAAIRICRTYVTAQKLYAATGHDGQIAGVYAMKFRSDPGKQNGLYWAAAPGEKRSPLGDLVAAAAADGRQLGDGTQPSPFHGYYFKILTAQGPSAAGGARDYVVTGAMSRGFAMVGWPAKYDVTGIMTFIVNHDGVIYEKDLGPETDAAARVMSLFEPDKSWTAVNVSGK